MRVFQRGAGRKGRQMGWCSPRAWGWCEGRRRQTAEHRHSSLFTTLLGWEESLEHAQHLCHVFPTTVKCTFKPRAKISLSAITRLHVCYVVMTIRKVAGTLSMAEAFIRSRSESRIKTLFRVPASSNHLPSVWMQRYYWSLGQLVKTRNAWTCLVLRLVLAATCHNLESPV